jgi:serine phosphatase RsbU (regulator of sigma subunit)
MPHSNSTPLESLPLQLLLKRRETGKLLTEFKMLLPGVELALVRADGRLFVSTAGWPQTALIEQVAWVQQLAETSEMQAVQTAEVRLQPLLFQSQLVGVLVARGLEPSSGHQSQTAEAALRCLQHSLTMLLAEASEKQDVVRETLERYREINLLYQIGETIGASLDASQIPQLVLGETQRVIQSKAGVVLLPRAEGQTEFEVQASFGDSPYIEALMTEARPLAEQVRHQARPDIRVLPATTSAPIGAILAVPIKTQEQVLGLVLLGRLSGQAVFTASDQKLVVALASQAAIAIERIRFHQQEIQRQRLEKELAVGRQIQLSLLPADLPALPGWEFAASYQAARQVGGDLYDFLELPDESSQLGLLIADVTGKGVPAALFMAFSRTIIRTEAITHHNPATVLEQANRLIVHDNRAKMLLTAFYGTLDIHTGQLMYANAGHNWPLWLHAANGHCQELSARGIVLGAFASIPLEERQILVAPGDLLVFYTDGVTEAMDRTGQMFGQERLQTILTANIAGSAEQVCQAILQALENFTEDTPPSDDITLLVVKRQHLTAG